MWEKLGPQLSCGAFWGSVGFGLSFCIGSGAQAAVLGLVVVFGWFWSSV